MIRTIAGPRRTLAWAIFIGIGISLVLFGLSGCQDPSTSKDKSTASAKTLADKAKGSIIGYNHTADAIPYFYVGGATGPAIEPHGGGEKSTCCAIFPKKWRKELSVKVKWMTSTSSPGLKEPIVAWHEKYVPIEKYGAEGGTVQVHFLPETEVRVLISQLSAGEPNYPGPPKPLTPRTLEKSTKSTK